MKLKLLKWFIVSLIVFSLFGSYRREVKAYQVLILTEEHMMENDWICIQNYVMFTGLNCGHQDPIYSWHYTFNDVLTPNNDKTFRLLIKPSKLNFSYNTYKGKLYYFDEDNNQLECSINIFNNYECAKDHLEVKIGFQESLKIKSALAYLELFLDDVEHVHRRYNSFQQ